MAGECRKVTPSLQQVGLRVQFGGVTTAFPSLKRSGSALLVRNGDDTAYSAIVASTVQAASAIVSDAATITPGSGTGFTVVAGNRLQRAVYVGTVAKEVFVAAAGTADFTIGTLPAKTVLLGAYCDTTAAFGGLAGTITLMVGVGATPNTILVAHDVKSAPVTKGLADADLGTDLARATAVQGGKCYSFSGTTAVLARLTSGTGNIGSGTVTNLTTGAATIYLITERLP